MMSGRGRSWVHWRWTPMLVICQDPFGTLVGIRRCVCISSLGDRVFQWRMSTWIVRKTSLCVDNVSLFIGIWWHTNSYEITIEPLNFISMIHKIQWGHCCTFLRKMCHASLSSIFLRTCDAEGEIWLFWNTLSEIRRRRCYFLLGDEDATTLC